MKEAVLICNGPSAEGYEPPKGVFVLGLNDAYAHSRLDAALCTDCPPWMAREWAALEGVHRIAPAHNPAFKAEELLECEDLLRKYKSSMPCGLKWLAEKDYTKVTVIGCDALVNLGEPGAAYSAELQAEALSEFAPRFRDGLFVYIGGRPHKVDEKLAERAKRWKRDAREARRSPGRASGGEARRRRGSKRKGG